MSLNVLFAGGAARWAEYESPLGAALTAAGIDARLSCDLPPDAVDYIVYAPTGQPLDFAQYPKARAVLSLWAGVEQIVTNATLTQPLCRMVDPGLREGMRDYVCAHVLRYHVGMDAHIVNPAQEWIFAPPPLARSRKVAVLGLGELGAECARALAQLGFEVHGWARREKAIDGVTCHAGKAGLGAALEGAEITVLLLPATPQTENLLNGARLAALPFGARIINPGRGALIDDAALLGALESGQIAHATLDVFRIEPLPADDPFWAHPRVTVTPHVASETRADTASGVIAENIARGEAGAPFLYLVDRDAGY